jgi:hypothetical protein
MQKELIIDRLKRACLWMGEKSQVKNDDEITEAQKTRFNYKTWNGALKGEYLAKDKEWDFFCPIWHTGQAVKAFVMAENFIPGMMAYAEKGISFILGNMIELGPDAGLILAFEDMPGGVNTSAIIECLDGFFFLGEKTGDAAFKDKALFALDWVEKKCYIDGEGVFRDTYIFSKREFTSKVYNLPGRPLLDDGIFLKAYQLTGKQRYLTIALEVAERLLNDEAPAGNWVKFPPCQEKTGKIHPRHAYWWGRPMLMLYKHTGDEKYFEQFKRSVEWYRKAMRKDGGIFRNTYVDFSTDSFGHAASGSACAVIMFLEYYNETGDKTILPFVELGMEFCMNMQLIDTEDQNLEGVVLEKVLPPGNSDSSPYKVRDLGTVFFAQAATRYLEAKESGVF